MPGVPGGRLGAEFDTDDTNSNGFLARRGQVSDDELPLPMRYTAILAVS